jgi:hypothetical protein
MNIDAIQKLVEDDGIVFLTYGGFLSQALIAGMTEALEQEAEQNDLNMGDSSNIFTIFIELAQNMMNYSKEKNPDSKKNKAEGLIVVGKDKEGNYYLHSQNVVALEDKEKIEPKLVEIKTFDREQIKQKYKELRRSGANTHGKGGGIGFYEIAKRCDEIEYEFNQINENKFYFHFKATIITKKEK